MKKEFQSTIEESIEAHFRIAELLGTPQKLKWIGLSFAPVVFIALFFILDNLAAKLIVGGAATGLFVYHHLSTYENNFKKRIRKTLVKALGTDQPISSEYEMDESGIIFRKLGQEIKFSWRNAKEFTITNDSLEVVMEPTGITVIPKRIFEKTQDLEQWSDFIENHMESKFSKTSSTDSHSL